MLYSNWKPNIATTMSQCWLTSANIETTFGQHCVNVVATLLSTMGTYVETMLRQCCVSVVAMSLSTLRPMLRQLSGNIVWMLSQHWLPMLYLVGLGPEWQLYSNLNFLQLATSTCISKFQCHLFVHFLVEYQKLCSNMFCLPKDRRPIPLHTPLIWQSRYFRDSELNISAHFSIP